MLAITYNIKPLGWLACKAIKHVWRPCLYSAVNGLALRQVQAPPLPGDDWVRVRTLLGGLCGTDLSLVAQKQPPNSILQAFSSMPMILGHENVAVVAEVGPAVDKSWLGRRVCVEPTLGCTARGIVPPCGRCAAGEFGACENFGADGLGKYKLPPGTSIGYNRVTGGSFGENFVAHLSQLVPVPDGISDEQAILTDPLACSLHAVLRANLAPAQGGTQAEDKAQTPAKTVLVYGAGVLGLGVIACLRAVGYRGRIDALDYARHLETLARSFGADNFIRLPRDPRGRFETIAHLTGGAVQRVRFNNYMLSGGYDTVFECVGSVGSITESLKWTRARGQMVMVGTGSGRGVDLTPVWFRELNVLGTYGRQIERFAGREIGTYQLVHELMAAGKLDVRAMLTHTLPLAQWRRAFEIGLAKGRHKAVKVAFDFR